MAAVEAPSCVACQSNLYSNPTLKLKVNECGHFICDNCIDALFVRGSAACPGCNTLLKRSQFREQIYDDPLVEKDIGIRNRLSKIFNLREEDFATSREYNDYEELYEWIVYNLVHDINVEEQNEKIEEFKIVNKDKIARNRFKTRGSDYDDYQRWEAEERQAKARVAEEKSMEVQRKQQRKRQYEMLLDELQSSDATPEEIEQRLQSFREAEMEEERLRLQKVKVEPLQVGALVGGRRPVAATSSPFLGGEAKMDRGVTDADSQPIVATLGPYRHAPSSLVWVGPEPPTESEPRFQSLLRLALKVCPPEIQTSRDSPQTVPLHSAVNDVRPEAWLQSVVASAYQGLFHDV